MDRSIAEGPDGPLAPEPGAGRLAAVVVGLLLAFGALALYTWSNPEHYNQYNHFVWQADAFLHGRVSFDWPVPDGADRPPNWYFNDIYPLFDASGQPNGQVLLPVPAPPGARAAAVRGGDRADASDQEAIAVALAAIGVGRRVVDARRPADPARRPGAGDGPVRDRDRVVVGGGRRQHVVLRPPRRGDLRAARRRRRAAPRPARRRRPAGRRPDDARATGGEVGWWAAVWPLDRSQVLAGLLLGHRGDGPPAAGVRARRSSSSSAAAGRGRGGSCPPRPAASCRWRRCSCYTQLTTGSWLHPGYDYQYQLEANGYPTLGYHPDWSVEDLRYIPQNLGIMFGALPVVAPDVKPNTLGFGDPVVLCTAPGAQRSLFDPDCPLVMPIDIGTSILLSAPGLLIALFAVRRHPLARLTVGVGVTVVVIALFNLAHFSQGWVQWGYRFSLDFIPFLLPLVALGAGHADGRPRGIAIALVIAGAAINLWGVAWGQLLGW